MAGALPLHNHVLASTCSGRSHTIGWPCLAPSLPRTNTTLERRGQAVHTALADDITCTVGNSPHNVSGPPAPTIVYLEEILNEESLTLHSGLSSRASRSRGHQKSGQLAIEGSYTAELRMLNAIYSRARREAAGPPGKHNTATSSEKLHAQAHASAKLHAAALSKEQVPPRQTKNHAAPTHATVEIAPGVSISLHNSNNSIVPTDDFDGVQPATVQRQAPTVPMETSIRARLASTPASQHSKATSNISSAATGPGPAAAASQQSRPRPSATNLVQSEEGPATARQQQQKTGSATSTQQHTSHASTSVPRPRATQKPLTRSQRPPVRHVWSSASRPAAMRPDLHTRDDVPNPAPEQPAATTGVMAILHSLAGISGRPLAEVIKQESIVASNHALLALGGKGRAPDVMRLLHAIVAAGRANEHTHAAAISAMDQAGRFDMAMQHFEDLCRRGQDVGPICASVLIKLCAQRRDLPMALDIFHRLAGQCTVNRYMYNCMIHLCAVMGQLDEALMVLTIMQEDGGPDTRPDSYTYAALLRAMNTSKQWAMLPRIYQAIMRSQIAVDSEVWCMLITAAGRAGRPDLAHEYHKACRAAGCARQHVDNALMAAMSRHCSMDEILTLYRSMLKEGLRPDEYTFNAILTTMCRVGASMYAVDDLVGELRKRDVKINTHLGTTLINAYKRSPEMTFQEPRLTTLLMEKAHEVLSLLAAQRQANTQTYGTVMAMHAQLGDAAGVQRLLARMEAAGVVPDGMTFLTVAKNCEEGGLSQLSEHFLHRAARLGVKAWPDEKPRRKKPWYDRKNKRKKSRSHVPAAAAAAVGDSAFEAAE